MGSFAVMRPLAPTLLLATVLGSACGASAPREDDIFHDSALRPGVVDADASERDLLTHLGTSEIAAAIVIGDRSYAVEAPYDAASGRRCRRVETGGERRLACENEDASWVFVPDIVRSRSDRSRSDRSRSDR